MGSLLQPRYLAAYCWYVEALFGIAIFLVLMFVAVPKSETPMTILIQFLKDPATSTHLWHQIFVIGGALIAGTSFLGHWAKVPSGAVLLLVMTCLLVLAAWLSQARFSYLPLGAAWAAFVSWRDVRSEVRMPSNKSLERP